LDWFYFISHKNPITSGYESAADMTKITVKTKLKFVPGVRWRLLAGLSAPWPATRLWSGDITWHLSTLWKESEGEVARFSFVCDRKGKEM